MKMVLGMLFLVLSNADFQFGAEKLTWRSYTATETLSTTSWVELIDKKEFAKAVLDVNSKTFVVHIAALEVPTAMPIYPFKASQLQDDPAQIAALQWDKTPIKIPTKYSDYTDVFSSDLAMELLENTGMNENAIELIDGKQLLYRPIYTLSLVELETLKTYIETHLKTRFIWPSKFPAGTSILFDKKPDGSLHLCVDY